MSLPKYRVFRSHRQGFHLIHNCTTAKDFIGFLIDYGIQRDVDGAVAMGKDFRKRELLSIVGGDGKHHHNDFEQSSRKLYVLDERVLHAYN